jgi:hypothetical protein
MLVSIFLLAFPQNGYIGISDFKYNIFLVLCGGYCFAIIVIRTQLAITGIQPLGGAGSLYKGIPLAAKLFLLYLGFIIISAIISEHPGTFRGAFRDEGVLSYALYILSSCFMARYFRPGKWLLWISGISICLFCVLSFVQLTGANPFALYPERWNYYSAEATNSSEYIGSIGNAGQSGAFLSIAAGVFAMALIKCDFSKNWQKWLLAITFFLTALLIFEMNVDAAKLALAGGLLLMLPVMATSHYGISRTCSVFSAVLLAFAMSQAVVFSDSGIGFTITRLTVFALTAAGLTALLSNLAVRLGFFRKIPRKFYRAGTIALIALAVCSSFLYIWFYGGTSTGVIYEISEIMRGRWHDSYGTGRAFIYRKTIENLRLQNLILGTGPDTFGYWEINFVLYTGMPELLVDAAHNEFLQILATCGVPALLCYIGGIVCTVAQWYKDPGNAQRAISGAGFLFYIIQAQFNISMPVSAAFFWLCFAIVSNSSIHVNK